MLINFVTTILIKSDSLTAVTVLGDRLSTNFCLWGRVDGRS